MESARPEEELERSRGHLLGLLLPAHGFTAPWSMVRFAARMPRGRGMHAFVVSTRGGSQIGPCRFPGMEGTALHSGMGQAAYDSIMSHSRPLAARFIDRILSGGRFYGSLICLAQGIALAPVSAGYLAVGRFGLAKLFFSNLRCDGCGVCATNCPRQTVEASQGFGAVLFKRPGFVMAALIPAVAAFAAQWSWGKYATGGLAMQLLSIPVALLTMWASPRRAWRNSRRRAPCATAQTRPSSDRPSRGGTRRFPPPSRACGLRLEPAQASPQASRRRCGVFRLVGLPSANNVSQVY